MEFYQKLQKLRKASGMSQEEMAAQLNVSRQAVSKWENGQGFPETDKLIQISNMFNVSTDYLLKEEQPEQEYEAGDNAYYASREMVEGYLSEKRANAFRISIGVAIIIVSSVFMFLLQSDLSMVFTLLTAAVGIVFLIWQSFMPKRYQELEKYPLVMDGEFTKELKNRGMEMRRRCGAMIAGGVLLLILTVVLMMVLQEILGFNGETSFFFFPISAAVSVCLFIIAGTELGAWNILLENKVHVEELENGRRFGWISGSIMSLAVTIFLFYGLVWNAWATAWVVFPIGGVLCGVVSGIVYGVAGGKK